MSVKVMTLVWSLPLRHTEKIVALAIADSGNDTGFAYPGYKTLMPKTGISSKSTLSKTIKILVDSGVFTKKPHSSAGQGRMVNTYQFNMNIDPKKLKKDLIIARKNNSNSPLSTEDVLGLSTEGVLGLSTEGVLGFNGDCLGLSTEGVLGLSTLLGGLSTDGVQEPLLEPLIKVVVVDAREENENSVSDAIETNMALKKWLEYFMNVKGYAQWEAQTVDTVPMFLEWEKMGVTDDDMVFVEIAIAKSLKGERPTTPLYYRPIVKSIVQKRKSQDTAANGPGSQSTLNTHQGEYNGTQRRNNEAHAATGKKPTAVEQQQQAERAYWEKQQRERGDNARPVN